MDNKNEKKELKTMINKYFSTIYIILGRDCNFHCKYCSQEKSTQIQRNNYKLSKKLINFLDNYKYKNTKIIFWGGEPLLYMSSIKFLLNRYENKFKWETITNGSLLTSKIINLFDIYNVRLIVSHDGKITEKTRNIDILKNNQIKNLLLNYKNFVGFLAVYSSLSNSYKEILNYFVENGFKEKHIKINHACITRNDPLQIKLADINTKKYLKILKEMLFNYTQTKNNDAISNKEKKIIDHYINDIKKALSRKQECKTPKYNINCTTCINMLNVDYDGNIFICHNSEYKIGTIEDEYKEIYHKLVDYLKQHVLPDCKKCEIFDICQGTCPILTNKGYKISCNLQKLRIKAIYSWAINFMRNRSNKSYEYDTKTI